MVGVASTASGTITNTAVVNGNQPDPNLANNTASVSTQIDVPVIPQSIADVGIVKTAASTVTVGSNLTYTLVVTNYTLASDSNPTGDATGVTVVDTLPAGFSYISASSQYSPMISGNTLTLNVGTLTPEGTSGDSATITIVGEVTAAAANTITNTATVSSIEQDLNQSNNTSKWTTTVLRQMVPSKWYYLSW